MIYTKAYYTEEERENELEYLRMTKNGYLDYLDYVDDLNPLCLSIHLRDPMILERFLRSRNKRDVSLTKTTIANFINDLEEFDVAILEKNGEAILWKLLN